MGGIKRKMLAGERRALPHRIGGRTAWSRWITGPFGFDRQQRNFDGEIHMRKHAYSGTTERGDRKRLRGKLRMGNSRRLFVKGSSFSG